MIGISLIALLLGLTFTIGYLKAQKDSGDVSWGKGAAQIGGVVSAYRHQYKRWPKDITDIQGMIKNDEDFHDFNLDAYDGLEFIENPNKVLTIRYKNFKDGNVTTGPGQVDISIQPLK